MAKSIEGRRKGQRLRPNGRRLRRKGETGIIDAERTIRQGGNRKGLFVKTTAVENVSQLNLNDSQLLSVRRDGRDVAFSIRYILDYGTCEAVPAVLVFRDVREFRHSDGTPLAHPDSFWTAEQTPLPDGNEYRLQMSSSGSTYVIRANSVELLLGSPSGSR